MYKRFVVFSIALVLSVFGIYAANKTTFINGINYSLNTTTRTAEVIENNPKYEGNINIPATITYGSSKYTVNSIGSYAFQSYSLESVTIPNTISSIGKYAFAGSSIKSITIPKGVTIIQYGTFWGCRSLTTVNLPDGLTTIDKAAFGGCTALCSTPHFSDSWQGELSNVHLARQVA